MQLLIRVYNYTKNIVFNTKSACVYYPFRLYIRDVIIKDYINLMVSFRSLVSTATSLRLQFSTTEVSSLMMHDIQCSLDM